MDKKIFYIRRSNKGLGAILSSRHPRTVIVYAQSPYATRKQNRRAGEKAVGSLQTILLQSIDREQRGVLVRTL